MKVAAIIPAAGRGRRMGGAIEKQFLQVAGMPLLRHALEPFARNPRIQRVVVASPPDRLQEVEAIGASLGDEADKVVVVAGGRERQQSVAIALQQVPLDWEVVLIHDGARPLVRAELIDAVIDAAVTHGAAVAAVPATDTVKLVEAGRVTATVARERVWLAQTPQGFRADLIRRAHQQAQSQGLNATDDAALVEALGEAVVVVPGDRDNIKVTTRSDLLLLEVLLQGGRLQ